MRTQIHGIPPVEIFIDASYDANYIRRMYNVGYSVISKLSIRAMLICFRCIHRNSISIKAIDSGL